MDTTMKKVVGRNVAKARKHIGLTQAELGEAMQRYIGHQWTKQVVSFVERGERQLDTDELLMIGMVLGRRVYDLLLPEEGEQILLPSGFRVPAGEVRFAVAGDATQIPVVATIASQLEELATQADFVADQARQVANTIHPRQKAKGKKR
jgi:transcriptional regulator with XRE-family HTH domain